MGRQRSGRPGATPAGNHNTVAGPVAGRYATDTGFCELVEDKFNPNGWVLNVNGVPSSHIDVVDPLRLDFEYMRWIAALTESRWPRQDGLRALHLGGGACSLPRYLAAAYPRARQVVVELDGSLAALVRLWFDLPRAPLLRIRVGEARAVVESLSGQSRDLVIRDVFAGSVTPRSLTTLEFTRHVRRVLGPDGLYVLNCGDSPDLAMARREAATMSTVFPHTAMIADPAMLKGRRYGNIILAGSDLPFASDPLLARALLGGGVPAQLKGDGAVRRFCSGAQVLLDGQG
jgi:hypothetical protein